MYYAHINEIVACSKQNILCQNSVLQYAGNATCNSLNFYNDKTNPKKPQPTKPKKTTPLASEGWLFWIVIYCLLQNEAAV